MIEDREPRRRDDPPFVPKHQRSHARRDRDDNGLDIGRHLIWVVLALAITVVVGWW